MEKLTLKEIAGYLPYGLKVSKIHTLHAEPGIGNINQVVSAVNRGLLQYRPILYPLEMLTKTIVHNGVEIIPIEYLGLNKNIDIYDPINPNFPIEINLDTEDYSQSIDLYSGYEIVEKLFEMHFDVFGLLKRNLAIDKSTLNSK